MTGWKHGGFGRVVAKGETTVASIVQVLLEGGESVTNNGLLGDSESGEGGGGGGKDGDVGGEMADGLVVGGDGLEGATVLVVGDGCSERVEGFGGEGGVKLEAGGHDDEAVVGRLASWMRVMSCRCGRR